MKAEETRKFIRWCILGAIGGILMAAGDWLLGCIPIQPTDTGIEPHHLQEPQPCFLVQSENSPPDL